jgi:hypothetical protein
MALAASPALAQEDTVTVTFEVTGAAGCPEEATFFALVGPPFSEYQARQLTDEDGDGTFTLQRELPAGEDLVIRIDQGTGTQDTQFGTFPGEPSRILRQVSTSEEPSNFTEDATISASAACPADDGQDGVAGDQQGMPEGMPETGAGAAAGLPVAPLAGLASLGTLGALGVLLRR